MDIKEYKVKKGDNHYPKGTKVIYSCRFWYYRNGEKRSKFKKGFLKKKEAEGWGIDEKRKLERLRIDSNKLTVKDFLDRWIKIRENKLAPTTLNGYKVNINHINKYIGNIVITDLQTIDIQEMADSLTAEGLKYRTVKYVCRTLHAALQYALKNKIITENRCIGIDIAEDEENFVVHVYTADDLSNLLILLKEQEHPLYIPVLLASMRGLRRGECLGLAWHDIDFDKNIAHIRNNYVVVNKKEYHRKVKTKDSERIESIDGFIADELKEYKERMIKSGQIQTYVCERDGRLPNPSCISKQLNAFQKANNLPICRFHDLRHTFAVLQLELGTDLDTLKRLLGHSKIGITSDLYLHQNMTLIKKASTKLDNVITLKNKKNLQKSQ